MDYNKELMCHKMLLSNSTLRFTQGMFQHLNKTPFIIGAHHRMICDALDRVVKGGSRKLMINIAPRYGKCVSPETFIHTETGLVTAGEVKAGDMLYSYLDGKAVLRRCVAVGDAKKYTVTVVSDGGIVFTCSTDHPILTETGEYVEAARLMKGDGVVVERKQCDIRPGFGGWEDFCIDHVMCVVLGGMKSLVDIEVEDTHNFIGNGLVSHNTELCSKQFIAYGFAINPQSNFLHLSYSSSLTQENSMAVKDIVKCEYYKAVYETRINPKEDSRSRWSTVQGGKMYATSTLGQITGFGAGRTDKETPEGDDYEEITNEFFERFNPDGFAGAIVIDDPIKPEDALSENVRETVNRRFETTIRNRVNSRNTPIVIIMQRLHEHDLCGYLLEAEPNEWEVLKIPVISYNDKGEEVALWPFKHTLEELHSLRDINSWVFDTQYMQDPMPIEGQLFPKEETKYFDVIPDDPDLCFIQVDPADEGDNMYCSKVFYIKDGYCYNVDTIYSADRLEIMLPRQKEQILKWNPAYVNMESNTAWRLVAKEIKAWVAGLELNTEVRRFSVHDNKELRIFNEAPTIRNRFFYLTPTKQNSEYQRCMRDKHSYLKMVKDQKDDGVDCDASASVWAKKNGLLEIM